MVDLRFASAQRVAPAAQRAEVPVQWMGAHGRTGDIGRDDQGPALDAAVAGLLSAEGWAYASALPVDAGDPGRFHALFGRDSLIFALQVRQRPRGHRYHRGSIWPFDNWITWAGLRRHGPAEVAERVRSGVLRALAELGRYPELYAVDPDETLGGVPLANRVQA
jgi:glycogen debranching enzyme